MRVLVVFLITSLLMGCATKLTSMPISDEEYLWEMTALKQEYTDIEKYQDHWRGFIPDVVVESDVIDHLGEPVNTQRNWWYPAVMIGTLTALSAHPVTWGVVFAIRPDAPKKVYFKKQDYCVEANIDRTFINGYEPVMYSWSWSKDQELCKK